jgi:hypothetical protein
MRDILRKCLVQWFLYGYDMDLNVLIFAFICSMITRFLARRLLKDLSLSLKGWHLLAFRGMVLFAWNAFIPKYPRSAYTGSPLYNSFPTVLLYRLKSCSLPFPSCMSIIFPFFPSIITCVLSVWRFFFLNNTLFDLFRAVVQDFLSHLSLCIEYFPQMFWESSCLAV